MNYKGHLCIKTLAKLSVFCYSLVMKKVYLIHGWSGSPQEPMHQWLISELQRSGYEVQAPVMPNPDEPIIKDWVNKLNEVAGPNPGGDAIFVGHSIGCQTILRYLEQLKRFGPVGGVVLIAPWFYLSDLETEEEKRIGKPWIETPIDPTKIWKQVPTGKLVAIFSDDDPVVPLEQNKERFENGYGAKIIVEKNKGHFTAEDGVNKLDSALKAILELS
jgi:uncharacterized protein